jgi:rhodanese-related sulfurtransferase
MNKIILLLSFISLAFADFTTLDTKKVQEIVKNNSMPLIDIRREAEWKQYGTIKGSHKLTFFDEKGAYDEVKWIENLHKIIKDKNSPFVLVCAHANRTKVVGRALSNMGYKNVYELGGGIKHGWIFKGLKTVQHN